MNAAVRGRAVSTLAKTLVIAVAAIAILLPIDRWLARIEASEVRAEAVRSYVNGKRLMTAGRTGEALEQFRSAMALEQDNTDYELAVGQTQLAAGKAAEAEATLRHLLEADPYSGAANLALARVFVRENKVSDAVFYYHRAIYGQWKENAAANQLQVRFELVDLLSHQSDSKEALLAELLPLQDEAPANIEIQKKLAAGFLAAGSSARAAAVYQGILRDNSEDEDAHRGLAEALFAGGNYRGAWEEFSTALRLNPEDEMARERFDLCMKILAIDPTLRGIGGEERYQRSRKLLESALDSLKQCAGTGAPQELVTVAERVLKKPGAPGRGDAYEENLDQAERLWRTREATCKQRVTPAEEPIARVFASLAQK
jgi:tetratricopeptide (TPR) repeat protein